MRAHQTSPFEIAQMLLSGEADIGLATESLADIPELASFNFYEWHHSVIVPSDHPLAGEKALTLDAIAEFPIITYHEGFTGRSLIDRVFSDAGLSPDVVMSALDADVIKTYVRSGLGIGIIASVAYDHERDAELNLLDTNHLFPVRTALIALRRGNYLRNFAYHFVGLCAPHLDVDRIRDGV